MRGLVVLCALSGAALLLAEQACAEMPGRDLLDAAKWPLEEVVLRDGKVYSGLIEDADDGVQLLIVNRTRGRKTSFIRRTIASADVREVKRLPPGERQLLVDRIEAYLSRDETEAARMEDLQLKRNGNVWIYDGRWFRFDSTGGEEHTRRSIVRMEQLFANFRRLLPPQQVPDRPLRMVMFGSTAEYKVFLQRIGLEIQNPAFFAAEQNIVVAASDLRALSAELARIAKRHEDLRKKYRILQDEIDEQIRLQAAQFRARGLRSADISRLTTVSRARMQKEVEVFERELAAYDRKNEQLFDAATRQMFETLYHESFHAYLENYVYSHAEHDVPRWLNEGLAQVFQAGLLEAGQLRVGAPDRMLLPRLKEYISGKDALRLADLLTADHRDFLVAHGSDGAASARHYIHAWGLAYYLAFEAKVLGTNRLDDYVGGAGSGDPIRRFEKLAGKPLPEFEAAWRDYIMKLR